MSSSYHPIRTSESSDDIPSLLEKAPPRSSSPSPSRRLSQRSSTTLIGLLIVTLLLSGAIISYFCLRSQSEPQGLLPIQYFPEVPIQPEAAHHEDPWLLVNGPPKDKFRDNLRNDTRYITSWVSAGWTNDVMTYANMLYLSIITERIPVIPPFAPSHVGWEAGYIAFSEVFDLDRLMDELKMPILEWHHLKIPRSEESETLGCWSTNMMAMATDPNGPKPEPRGTIIPQYLNVDPSYTPIPQDAKLLPQFPGEGHVSFPGLAKLAYPAERAASLVPEDQIYPSAKLGTRLPPDEHLLCYDFLYFVSMHDTYEWNKDYSVGWNLIGRHMHWSPSLKRISDMYLRRAFNMTNDSDEDPSRPIPPYIGLHIRRSDFGGWCEQVPLDECFAPLSAYARRVSEVQEILRQRDGLEVAHVFVTSDESDPEWWAQVRELGWSHVDHEKERTAELFGGWYPTLLDAVFQSHGVGFVGTDRSTMSLLARKRVVDWQKGVGIDVKWGFKDADAH